MVMLASTMVRISGPERAPATKRESQRRVAKYEVAFQALLTDWDEYELPWRDAAVPCDREIRALDDSVKRKIRRTHVGQRSSFVGYDVSLAVLPARYVERPCRHQWQPQQDQREVVKHGVLGAKSVDGGQSRLQWEGWVVQNEPKFLSVGSGIKLCPDDV